MKPIYALLYFISMLINDIVHTYVLLLTEYLVTKYSSPLALEETMTKIMKNSILRHVIGLKQHVTWWFCTIINYVLKAALFLPYGKWKLYIYFSYSFIQINFVVALHGQCPSCPNRRNFSTDFRIYTHKTNYILFNISSCISHQGFGIEKNLFIEPNWTHCATILNR